MMMIAQLLLSVLLLLFTSSVSALPFLKSKDVPRGDWMSLHGGSELKLVEPDHNMSQDQAKKFQKAQQRFLSSKSQFIDGEESYYDEYAQAWRLLGFYIDCGTAEEEYKEERRLGDSQDGESACERWLLWAAYVDLDYQGGGIGEYRYWDRKRKRWNRDACDLHGDGRCAKMDCHLPGTHFKPLAFFKEDNYAQWMEQLFKHEGICVWTEEEYEFMQNARGAWPEGCTQSVDMHDGDYIYFDIRPMENGRMSIGLYTDARCSVDYSGFLSTVQVLENYYSGYGDEEDGGDNYGGVNTLELASNLDTWNSAIDIFTYCQPCVAYNLNNFPGSENMQQGGGSGSNDASTDGYFECYDDAGYTNCNQCMKFRAKTDMRTALVDEIMVAASQGTITRVKVTNGDGHSFQVGGYARSGNWLLLIGGIVLLAGGCAVWYMKRKAKEEEGALKEPLVPSSAGVSV